MGGYLHVEGRFSIVIANTTGVNAGRRDQLLSLTRCWSARCAPLPRCALSAALRSAVLLRSSRRAVLGGPLPRCAESPSRRTLAGLPFFILVAVVPPPSRRMLRSGRPGRPG